MIKIIQPITGTRYSRSHHADIPMSCNRREATANPGNSIASAQIPPTASERCASGSDKTEGSRASKKSEDTNTNAINHQNSLRLARPEKVTNLLKHVATESENVIVISILPFVDNRAIVLL